MWDIVEFDDNTVQIVPDCWVSSDQKTCYWPPNGLFKSNKDYIKDVKKCVSPSITWSIYNVLIVLGKYGKYFYFKNTFLLVLKYNVLIIRIFIIINYR